MRSALPHRYSSSIRSPITRQRMLPIRLKRDSIVFLSMGLSDPVQNSRSQERDHDLVVAGDRKAAAVAGSGTLDHVLQGAVVLGHVEIGGGEGIHVEAHVLGDGKRLEEYLRHDHGAADVDEHTAVAKGRYHRGKEAEVGEGGLAQHGAVTVGMLVDDVGAHG